MSQDEADYILSGQRALDKFVEKTEQQLKLVQEDFAHRSCDKCGSNFQLKSLTVLSNNSKSMTVQIVCMKASCAEVTSALFTFIYESQTEAVSHLNRCLALPDAIPSNRLRLIK